MLDGVSKNLLQPDDTANLSYDEFQEKLKDLGPKLRLTVIHEGDGRVVELDRAGSTDPIGGREQPLPRNFAMKPGDAS